MDDGPALTRRYYDAIDAHAYDELPTVLAPDFVQRRGDRTFDDRDAFVRFMREERPMTDTTHAVDDVFGTDRRAAARGRLLDADGEPQFGFADLFRIEQGRIAALETYTREPVPR